jgi:hypothetical protein
MSVRAKMRVTSLTTSTGETGEIRLYAVADAKTPENERYHRYTPSAEVRISIDNPVAYKYFADRIGKCVYVDFTEAAE